ncbi:ABC transporter ATP-binding protein [Oceanicoccus sp. KOV_DT_Chl]|uniref:ABC transporter ATP-binding protein n=1 Tax=Oceanicoccus sp. KOV_DT_Chl TaxID=1904639 RepID=UPI001F4538B3|nr:ABC transporter ATP-binding protein [Oceanicoccus sp. KOV_DT_Chl]
MNSDPALNSSAAISNPRFLLQYLLHHKKSYGFGIVLIFVTNWLAVNIPVHIGLSIDLLSGELAKNQQQLVYNIALVIGFALMMIVTRTVSRVLFFNPGRAIERELKDDAFAKLTKQQKDFYDGHETGKLISIVNNDINGVRALAGIVMLQIFNIFFALSLTPVKMWGISPSLTLYCIVPVIVTFFIAHRAIAYMRQMVKKRMGELQTLSSHTVGILSGIEEIKSYQVQPWAIAEFDVHNQAILARSLTLARIRTLVLPIIGYTDRIMKVLILAVGGSYLIDQGLTIGELTALLAYATLLAMPFISMGMIFSAYQTGMVSLESLRTILDQPVAAREQQHLSSDDRDTLFTQGIEVKNLSYRYPQDEQYTLKNISFTIIPGQTLGILGKVGAGKSTLVNCLNRYLDVDPGQVFIDGRDVTAISKSDLRSAVRTITQQPFLFSDTVANNIRFGTDDIDSDAADSENNTEALSLDTALMQSDMRNEVDQFPQRENTLVGEKGILLSGGQKQRLSLARAMYTPSKLMILDNVLSAVDNKTERFLLDQIFNNLRSQCTVIVSHRASVLEKVDHILVLEAGEIVAQGSHQQLLTTSDYYRETWDLQQDASQKPQPDINKGPQLSDEGKD